MKKFRVTGSLQWKGEGYFDITLDANNEDEVREFVDNHPFEDEIAESTPYDFTAEIDFIEEVPYRCPNTIDMFPTTKGE